MNLMRPSRACSSAWSVAMKILQPGPAAHLSCSLVLTNSRIARPALARCCGGATSHISASGDDAKARIEQMVKSKDVFVFMKGVPEAPRCGFSNAVCQILRMHAVPFKAFDVLSDEHIRQGIKDYSNWPTIPQVFFRGEFVGGCDILMQMHQSGELIEELGKIGIKSALAGEAS